MSGSSIGPIGTGSNSTTPEYCQTFSGETVVNSPDPAVLSTISVGDILEIEVRVVNGVSVVAIVASAGVLGGLSNYSNRLEYCIEEGFSYQATVLDIRGAIVTVRISA